MPMRGCGPWQRGAVVRGNSGAVVRGNAGLRSVAMRGCGPWQRSRHTPPFPLCRCICRLFLFVAALSHTSWPLTLKCMELCCPPHQPAAAAVTRAPRCPLRRPPPPAAPRAPAG
eukprot:352365-Chlamydomonas_euryale.AAC.1